MRDFRRYVAFGEARELVRAVYQVSAAFPSVERFGITSQLRRAAVSVAANIAEGCGRDSDAEFARFLDIAIGSLIETECLLMLASDVGLVTPSDLNGLEVRAERTRRLLFALRNRIRLGTRAPDPK